MGENPFARRALPCVHPRRCAQYNTGPVGADASPGTRIVRVHGWKNPQRPLSILCCDSVYTSPLGAAILARRVENGTRVRIRMAPSRCCCNRPLWKPARTGVRSTCGLGCESSPETHRPWVCYANVSVPENSSSSSEYRASMRDALSSIFLACRAR